jgi:hypothetical protein
MSIYDSSFFVSQEVKPFDVELPGGQKVQLWFKEIPHWLTSWLYDVTRGDDLVAKAKSYARILSESLCEPNGEPAMTYEKALTLKPDHCYAIFSAMVDADKGNSGEDSPSEGTGGSGTSSPSRSAKRSESSKRR